MGDIGLLASERIPEAIEKGVVAAAKQLDAAKESLALASIPSLAPEWIKPGRKDP